MARLTNILPVTNVQGYDKFNRCFICHKWPWIWLVYSKLYLSRMIMDMTMQTDTLSGTNDQGHD